MKKKKSLRRFQSPVADLDCPQARIHAKESRTCNVFRNAKKCSIQWLIRLMIEWNNDTLQVGLEPLVGEIPISLRSKNPQRTGAIRDDLWRFTRPPPLFVFSRLQQPSNAVRDSCPRLGRSLRTARGPVKPAQRSQHPKRATETVSVFLRPLQRASCVPFFVSAADLTKILVPYPPLALTGEGRGVIISNSSHLCFQIECFQ